LEGRLTLNPDSILPDYPDDGPFDTDPFSEEADICRRCGNQIFTETELITKCCYDCRAAEEYNYDAAPRRKCQEAIAGLHANLKAQKARIPGSLVEGFHDLCREYGNLQHDIEADVPRPLREAAISETRQVIAAMAWPLYQMASYLEDDEDAFGDFIQTIHRSRRILTADLAARAADLAT
jgi:hypothetical protein